MEMKNNIRSLRSENISINNENVIEISFASSTPYTREQDGYLYNEILVISEQAVNWERLIDNRSPLLLDHNMQKQIGVVQKAFIADGKLKAIVRFSENEFPQQILKDVKDGIRRNVSFGYIIDEYRIEKTADIDNVYVTKFTPYEISFVSCPADPFVGYQRSINIKENSNMAKDVVEETEATSEISEDIKEEVEETTSNEAVEQVKEDVKEDIKEDVKEDVVEQTAPEEVKDQIEQIIEEDEAVQIKACGEMVGEEELAKKCIAEKRSLSQFKNLVKNKINNNKQTKETSSMKRFSISRAIKDACKTIKGEVDASYERSIIEQNKRKFHVGDDVDILVTREQLRALAPSGTVGGALVNTDYLPQQYTPVIRPPLTLDATGYTAIPVEGNAVSFAVGLSGATAAMYDLDGELNDGDMQWTLKTLTPHKAGVCIPVPYSLLLQGRPEVDGIIEADIVNALAECRDQQLLKGTGSDNQVTGITAASGTNEYPISGIYSLSGVCEAEQMIRDSNDFGDLCWVMNGANYTKFRTTLKDDNGFAGYLLEDGKLNGIPVYVNNALGNNVMILGNFRELVVADFDGLRLKVDEYSLIKRQAIQLIVTSAFDCVVRRAKSFTIVK